MRGFIIFLIVILAILTAGDLLLWVIATASGHQLPAETNNLFLTYFFLFFIPTILLFILLKRVPKERKKSSTE